MEKLAASISANTSLLARELRENGHPAPTMGKECPIYFPALGVEATIARTELIQAAEDLILLASGPYDSFLNLSFKV
jgi:6-hydroxytryprostatin B O-methyltransferase